MIASGSPPDSFTRLGTIEPSVGPERVLAVWTPWQNLAREVLTQWRWDHDRKAILIEEAVATGHWKSEPTVREARNRELEHLTLGLLLKKRRFSGWKGDRSDKAITACREAVRRGD